MEQYLSPIIGSDGDTILWWQMVIRGVVVFLYGVLLVRLAPMRVFGRLGAFDIILAVILGSVLSRALTGNAEFLPALLAAGALVLLHSMLALISAYSRRIGYLVKGEPVQIVSDGWVDRKAMRRAALGEGDLELALRTNGVTDPARIEAAYLERNGRITVVKTRA